MEINGFSSAGGHFWRAFSVCGSAIFFLFLFRRNSLTWRWRILSFFIDLIAFGEKDTQGGKRDVMWFVIVDTKTKESWPCDPLKMPRGTGKKSCKNKSCRMEYLPEHKNKIFMRSSSAGGGSNYLLHKRGNQLIPTTRIQRWTISECANTVRKYLEEIVKFI